MRGKSDYKVSKVEKRMLLELKNITFEYKQGSGAEKRILHNVSLSIGDGEFIGVIGHTGSGKSTLLQIMCGLIQPVSGSVNYREQNIANAQFDKQKFHCNIGMVFQYPENQLFGNTVMEDVMFGPLNKGVSEEEAKVLAQKYLRVFHIDEDYHLRSPFELSGGEKRRVALAGVLAMEPELLILDEPVAGLDPFSRRELLEILREYNQAGHSVLMVSHSMEDVACYAQRVIVMNQGRIYLEGTREEVFRETKALREIGLDVPEAVSFMEKICDKGFRCGRNIYTVDDVVNEIVNCMEMEKR